jgi:hypothetical protein
VPPPRQYPGLGTPIDSGLPFDVSPGTRRAGMEMLQKQMQESPGHIPSIGEVLFGMTPDPSLEERMAAQRGKVEEVYYGAPTEPSTPPGPAHWAFDIKAMQRPNRLGPKASGRAEPALLTDEMVRDYALTRGVSWLFPWASLSSKPIGKPTDPPGGRRGEWEERVPPFGLTPGAGPQKQLASGAIREENLRRGDEFELPLVNDPSVNYTMREVETKGKYPMPVFPDASMHYPLPFLLR